MYSVASLVVICSSVILSSGISLQIKSSFFNKNSFSIKNINIFICHFAMYQSGIPISAIIFKTGIIFSIFLTPELEFVVAPAGYNFAAKTSPLSYAFFNSFLSVFSVNIKSLVV